MASAGIILLDPVGRRVLLQLRDKNGHPSMADGWAIPGGTVEAGESPTEAIIREVKEETGYQLSNPIQVLFVKEEGLDIYIFAEIYDGQQKVECFEGLAMEFKEIGSIPKLKLVPLMQKHLATFNQIVAQLLEKQ